MLARLFPLNSNNITQESYSGIKDQFQQQKIKTLWILILIEALILKLLHKENKAQGALFYDKKTDNTKNQNNKNLIYNLLMIVFCIPLFEETLFRGILTPALEKIFAKLNINTSYAPIATSILFGFSHPNGQKLWSIYFGIKQEQLTKIYNGSLWGSIAGHSANNLCASFPPMLFYLYGLTNAVSKFYDETKRITDTTEDLTHIKTTSKAYQIFFNALWGAIDGAKLGGTNTLWFIPSIIISQIQNNNNFTECFTGSLTQSVKL